MILLRLLVLVTCYWLSPLRRTTPAPAHSGASPLPGPLPLPPAPTLGQPPLSASAVPQVRTFPPSCWPKPDPLLVTRRHRHSEQCDDLPGGERLRAGTFIGELWKQGPSTPGDRLPPRPVPSLVCLPLSSTLPHYAHSPNSCGLEEITLLNSQSSPVSGNSTPGRGRGRAGGRALSTPHPLSESWAHIQPGLLPPPHTARRGPSFSTASFLSFKS